jgi:hypothetical protein
MPSLEVDDGHEVDLDEALKKMIPSGKHDQDCFLRTLIATAQPVNIEDHKVLPCTSAVCYLTEALNTQCTTVIFSTMY